jgi:drug/metabolite transporter (DMT)-like permease
MDLKETWYSFIGGFAVSVLGNWTWLHNLQIQPPNVTTLVIEWTIKVFGTLILGVIGGLAGLWAKDIYKWLKK